MKMHHFVPFGLAVALTFACNERDDLGEQPFDQLGRATIVGEVAGTKLAYALAYPLDDELIEGHKPWIVTFTDREYDCDALAERNEPPPEGTPNPISMSVAFFCGRPGAGVTLLDDGRSFRHDATACTADNVRASAVIEERAADLYEGKDGEVEIFEDEVGLPGEFRVMLEKPEFDKQPGDAPFELAGTFNARICD